MRTNTMGIIVTCLLTAWSVYCPVSFAGDRGQELIHAACRGDVKKVQGLLDNGADINAPSADGKTALMVAAAGDRLKRQPCSSQPEMVELLKKHGAKE